MQLGIVGALLFSVVIAVFALANNQPVMINYLFGQVETSVVLVILASAALGAFVIGILNLVWRVKTGFRFREYERKIKTLSAHACEMESEYNMLRKEFEILQGASVAAATAVDAGAISEYGDADTGDVANEPANTDTDGRQ